MAFFKIEGGTQVMTQAARTAAAVLQNASNTARAQPHSPTAHPALASSKAPAQKDFVKF
jgi:hypothetical protein